MGARSHRIRQKISYTRGDELQRIRTSVNIDTKKDSPNDLASYAPKKLDFSSGLDELGRIINFGATSKIPEAYRAVVDDAVQSALCRFPGQIHSMYICGSVSRGTAQPGESDLDVCVLLLDEPPPEQEAEFTELAHGVAARHPIISKLDYSVVELSSATSPEQRHGWQFWLKGCCVNLWGEDITTGMELSVPCLELAYGLNGDVRLHIQKALSGLTEENVGARSRSIAKKLVRTAYSLIAADDRSWYTDVERCAGAFVVHHPEHAAQMAALAEIAKNGSDLPTLRRLLESFGQQIIELFERETAKVRK